ncbi:DUF4013 domain-containing protein [Halorussus gelatinilyticus]|uniref:DUF4013 domain-containing protein n=1 Tax=Halorussus gelatinilyticus TaxID=2937524 RepID=A0A8U0IIY6_9EURY|nr:DUF4013 domain-containing protein [Halorussus gelatinilyticus]UPW00656.1 DUF4013 domain-containing protein [Halorussus gelatinilyticus]
MFKTALRYVVDSDDGTKTLLVGGLLTLFSWLLIPAVFVAGYLQRVLARTNAEEPAPSFDDWGDLFAEGLKAIVVTLAYFALPVVLLTAVAASLVVFSVETTVVESDAGLPTDPATVAEPVTNVGPDLLSVVVVFGGLALAGLTALVAWYVLPAALARLAVEGRLGAAFQFRPLWRVVTTNSYATGWLVALVVLVVGGALVGALASIPFVGWVLIPFATFYLDAVAFALYGQGYREATPTDRRETVGGSERATA